MWVMAKRSPFFLDPEGRGANGCIHGLDVWGTWRMREFVPAHFHLQCTEGKYDGSDFSLRVEQES